jgi:hypothetical protein
MLDRKLGFVVSCLALTLAGCGSDGSGADATSAVASDLRLASEATTKPVDSNSGTASTTGTTTEAGVLPTKTSTGGTTTSTTPSLPTSVAPYDPSALPVIGGEPSASATWPAWRKALSRWQWKQIPNSDLSSVVPSPSVPGALSARIDAWNGLAADTRTNRLYSAANGGHSDYSGNEVVELDLSGDAVAWRMLRAPTPTASIVASDYTKGVYNDYYLDGRPASTHTYYALQFIASRNAIFKFGAGSMWGTGNESNWKTDAFSLASNDWHSAGTWPDASERGGTIGAPVCKNPYTEEVYVATPAGLKRFDPASGTYASLANWPDNSTAVYARACAVDPVRNRVVFFGDAYRMPTGGLMYDAASNSISRITFTGAASDITAQSYHYAWYEAKIGRFLLKTTASDKVYQIDPQTLAVALVGTSGGAGMPDAVNGVQSRWQRLPNLGGYAYYPRNGSGVWFLAVE